MDQEKPRARFWLFVLILFIFLQIGDGLSTYILTIKTFAGEGVEGNPFIRYLFGLIGVLPALISAKVAAILLGLFIYIKCKSPSNSRYVKVFFIVTLFYVAVNIWNWYLVYYVMTTGQP